MFFFSILRCLTHRNWCGLLVTITVIFYSFSLFSPTFKGFPTVVLILEHNIKVFVVVSMVSDGKNDADVFSIFAIRYVM